MDCIIFCPLCPVIGWKSHFQLPSQPVWYNIPIATCWLAPATWWWLGSWAILSKISLMCWKFILSNLNRFFLLLMYSVCSILRILIVLQRVLSFSAHCPSTKTTNWRITVFLIFQMRVWHTFNKPLVLNLFKNSRDTNYNFPFSAFIQFLVF